MSKFNLHIYHEPLSQQSLHQILSAAKEKVVSTAKDVYIGCSSANQEALLWHKVRKMSLIELGGWPYKTIFITNIYYFILTNIDVSDSLENSVVGKLVHFEAGEVIFVWFDFSHCLNIGNKIKRKVTSHKAANNISQKQF